jgi:hypothetical protein
MNSVSKYVEAAKSARACARFCRRYAREEASNPSYWLALAHKDFQRALDYLTRAKRLRREGVIQ